MRQRSRRIFHVPRRHESRAKADARLGRGRWRGKKWLELRPDDLERLIVFEKRPIDLGEALENCGVGGELLSRLGKCPDDIHTHRDRLRDIQHHRSHDRSVFGKGVGRKLRVLPAL